MVPREDEDEKRRRERREREDADDEASGSMASKRAGLAHVPTAVGDQKLLQLLDQATPMIEQLNNLYNQFFAGTERVPPIERRKQLDQTMATIMMTPKITAPLQFRAQTLNSSYISARDRWDRMLKDLESGKLKRMR